MYFSRLIFLMIRDVSTYSVDDVFVHGVRQLSVDLGFRAPAPLPCKFPGVGLHLGAVSIGTCLPKARFSQDLVCRVSCVGRCVVELSGQAGPSRVRSHCTRGVLPGPTGCHRVQDDPVTKSQPLCVLVGVVTSCVPCARVRGRVSRSCATENTYTPPRLEALSKLSVFTILSHSYHFHQHFCCGFWVLVPTRHLVRDVLRSMRVRSNISADVPKTPFLRKSKSVSLSED